MKPVVSVIVPVYNVADYLRRSLDSLAQQTLTNIEIVCVDDGSTDNSAAILAEYEARDGRFKVLHQANAGQSAARNAGLDASSAEFVAFCDADDWAEPMWCERMYRAFSKSADIDLVVTRAEIAGSCSSRRRKSLERNQRLRFRGVVQSSSALFPRVDHSLWTKMFRRDVLDRYAVRFSVGEFCEDWSFAYAYLAVCRNVCFLDSKLYHYFQRDGSTLNGGAGGDRVLLDYVRQWGRLRHFLVSAGKWFEWRGAMLEFGVRMFGCGGEAVRQRVYSLADEVLAQLQPEDLDGLSPKLVVDVEHVRQHVIHKYLCRRWKVGPLTLAKRVSDISGDRLFVLGVRVWARWY